MKVLILCGVFEDACEEEVLRQSKRAVEFSANLMQKKLIDAFFSTEHEVHVLSAPFLGAYPTASTTRRFRGFAHEKAGYTYVSFDNLWGVRNLSRCRALKRALRPFLAEKGEKLILAYCPHTPFIKAAAYAKQKDPEVRTCLYVPDLPEYMNLSAKISPLYRIAKLFDIRAMHRAMKKIDSFVLLTEQMKERLPVGDKPYFVSEGLVTEEALSEAAAQVQRKTAPTRDIVYTGKLDLRFGLKTLVDAMRFIPSPDCRLVLCGTGDAEKYAEEASKTDARILLCGQVPPAEAARRREAAAVLVNPRAATEEYTKYSFPSKNLEYLLGGAPVVAHFLKGMPEEYRGFFLSPTDSTPESLARALFEALSLSEDERLFRHRAFLAYAEEHLCAKSVIQKILRTEV